MLNEKRAVSWKGQPSIVKMGHLQHLNVKNRLLGRGFLSYGLRMASISVFYNHRKNNNLNTAHSSTKTRFGCLFWQKHIALGICIVFKVICSFW